MPLASKVPLTVDKVGFQWSSRLLDVTLCMGQIANLCFALLLHPWPSCFRGEVRVHGLASLWVAQGLLPPTAFFDPADSSSFRPPETCHDVTSFSCHRLETPVDVPSPIQCLQIPSDFAQKNPSFCHSKVWFCLYFCKSNVSSSFQVFSDTATMWICHSGWSICMSIISFHITTQLPFHKTLGFSGAVSWLQHLDQIFFIFFFQAQL